MEVNSQMTADGTVLPVQKLNELFSLLFEIAGVGSLSLCFN
jgi:hypothetical protein